MQPRVFGVLCGSRAEAKGNTVAGQWMQLSSTVAPFSQFF